MSLSEAIDRIMNWMLVNQPRYANSFLPGLSKQEINSICEPIPGCLSDDIYELYQWRNGTNEEYWRWMRAFHMYYQPLSEVIESCLGLNDGFEDIENAPFNYNGCPLFPFSTIEKTTLCTLIFNETRESSPIVIADEDGVHLAFDSLNSMLNVLAEGLETGVFFLNDDSIIVCNDIMICNDVRTLFYKYNSSNIELLFI